MNNRRIRQRYPNEPGLPRNYYGRSEYLRRKRYRNPERGFYALGCLAVVLWLAWWGTIIFLVLHFVSKHW